MKGKLFPNGVSRGEYFKSESYQVSILRAHMRSAWLCDYCWGEAEWTIDHEQYWPRYCLDHKGRATCRPCHGFISFDAYGNTRPWREQKRIRGVMIYMVRNQKEAGCSALTVDGHARVMESYVYDAQKDKGERYSGECVFEDLASEVLSVEAHDTVVPGVRAEIRDCRNGTRRLTTFFRWWETFADRYIVRFTTKPNPRQVIVAHINPRGVSGDASYAGMCQRSGVRQLPRNVELAHELGKTVANYKELCDIIRKQEAA